MCIALSGVTSMFFLDSNELDIWNLFVAQYIVIEDVVFKDIFSITDKVVSGIALVCAQMK